MFIGYVYVNNAIIYTSPGLVVYQLTRNTFQDLVCNGMTIYIYHIVPAPVTSTFFVNFVITLLLLL